MPASLMHAYNDKQGVTAASNLNMLAHVNRRLAADSDPANIIHRVTYNAWQGRIEVHQACTRDHRVQINGNVYRFHSGETIHTEYSYKYSVTEFRELVAGVSFEPVRVRFDLAGLFRIHYLSAR